MARIKKFFLWFSAAIFAIAGLLLFFGNPDWFPDFYEPKFFGVSSIIWAFLIVLPGLVFRAPSVQDNSAMKKKDSIVNLQLALAFSFSLGGLGSLGFYQLYKFGFQYDKAIHFIVGLVITLAITHFIYRWYNMSFKKVLFLSAGLIIIGGFLWEFTEFASDAILGTKTFGIYGAEILKDTITDIIMDALGVITALLILILRRKKVK